MPAVTRFSLMIAEDQIAFSSAPGAKGNRRSRFPVASKMALATAGATGGTACSPNPPGLEVLGTM